MTTAGERLAKIETSLDYLKEQQEKHGKMLSDFITAADKKYANKTVEKIVYGMVGLIIVAFFYALIYLVIPGLK